MLFSSIGVLSSLCSGSVRTIIVLVKKLESAAQNGRPDINIKKSKSEPFFCILTHYTVVMFSL